MEPTGEPRQRPEDLRGVLRDCLVQVNQDPDYGGGGSGFFVAPGYVLTCSHVIRGADDQLRTGQAVSGLWGQRPWSGEVVFASQPPGHDDRGDGEMWPVPDIAVIRAADALAHPCVRLAWYRLDHGGPDDPLIDTRMHAAVRHAALGGPPGDFPIGELRYPGAFRGLLRLVGDRFGPGMSGGPVLDSRTGKVCAMLKAQTSDNGCYAVPLGDLHGPLPAELATAILRGHDRFHYEDRRWVAAQEPVWQQLVGASGDISVAPLLRPSEEAELLGLVEGLTARGSPSDAELYRLYESATASLLLRPDPGEPRDLRSLVFWLQDQMHPTDRPHPIIEFAASLATAVPEGEARYAAGLHDWCTAMNARMGGIRQVLNGFMPSFPAAAHAAEAPAAASPPVTGIPAGSAAESAQHADSDHPDLLLSIYLPNERLYAAEQRRVLSLFRDWLAKTRKHGIRQSEQSTARGTKFEFYADRSVSLPELRAEIDVFARFLDACADSRAAALDLLRGTEISAAAAAEMVIRFSKEVRRVQMDTRHAREQRMLSLKQALEEEVLEAGVDLRTVPGAQLDELLDRLVPLPSAVASLRLLAPDSGTGEQQVISLPPNASVIVNQKIFHAMEQTVIESVQGTVHLGAQAKEILTLIGQFAGQAAPVLTTAVHELEDPDAEPGSRRTAKAKLKQFLTQLAGKVEDAVLIVAEQYLASRGI